MSRIVGRYATIWAVVFLALLAYWETCEAAEPGIQYADPFWPCAWLATWPAHLWLVWTVSTAARRQER